MSAQPKYVKPTVPMVEFEINGHPVKAPKGSMIIQAADAYGIPLPRFCYHKKMPIAAVCRQCMVEVEMNGRKSPKPAVACATPVAPGMKVYTKSELAIHAQQSALEFVLINHPLDCPICDQGGECELQDLTLGYGRTISRFTERKRVVADENVGPLVATNMTRCIHCNRCVRFLGEVAGSYEFGDFDRGDRHVIGTWVGRGIESELSGNVIDVCPVGALTDKVFQFKARAWELIAKPSIGYHDALGSNLWLHTKRGKVLRTVPRDNEPINECWLSDRDRYSHEGLYAADRVQKPMIRKGADLVEVEWDEAIAFVAAGLKKAGSDVAALVAPMTSCEEGWLLSELVHGVGSQRIDHRLRIQDFSDGGPAGDIFELPVEDVAELRAGLIVGSLTRFEMPLLSQRIRRSTRHDSRKPYIANMANYDISKIDGAKIYVVNPVGFDFRFDVAGETICAPQQLVDALLAIAKAAGVKSDDRTLAGAIAAAPDRTDAKAAVEALRDAEGPAVVLLGDAATQHPQAAWLRALARAIAEATNSSFNELPAGANAIGLARVGARPSDAAGTARAIIENPPKALVTWQAGAQDSFEPAAFQKAREAAEFYVHAGAFACDAVRRSAAAVLPLGLPPEIDGTYVNVDGIEQMVPAGSVLPGDARPGWKVLRALGGALGVAGFDFVDINEVHARIAQRIETAPAAEPHHALAARVAKDPAGALTRLATVGIYRSDAVVRRAKALQAHPLNRGAQLRVCAADAEALGIANGGRADVNGSVLPVLVDSDVPQGCAWVESGFAETAALPPYGAALAIKAVGA